jgi:hypothetical protein
VRLHRSDIMSPETRSARSDDPPQNDPLPTEQTQLALQAPITPAFNLPLIYINPMFGLFV